MNRRTNPALSSITAPFTLKVRVRHRGVILRLTPDPLDGGYVDSSPSLRGLNSQHRVVKVGTLRGILRDTGLRLKEFMNLL